MRSESHVLTIPLLTSMMNETLSVLKLKHTPAHPNSCIHSLPEAASLTPVTEKEVVSADQLGIQMGYDHST